MLFPVHIHLSIVRHVSMIELEELHGNSLREMLSSQVAVILTVKGLDRSPNLLAQSLHSSAVNPVVHQKPGCRLDHALG